MRTVAILPIKGLGEAKSRLAGQLGAGSRQALAQAMFLDVVAALRRVPELDEILVVTPDPVARDALRGEHTVIDDSARAGHSAAAALGVRRALEGGADAALLVPGDTPLIEPGEVSALLRSARADRLGAAIVPDRHGSGTNALLLRPPDAIAPAFGPGSRERHVAAARAAGIAHRVEPVPSLLHDVDTPEDLADLAAALADRRGQASMTRGALRQLDRSRAAGASAGGRPPRERPPAARNVRVIGAGR